MKPWERALKREPMCAFIEAVVDGYSPLDKNLLRCARAGQLLRSIPWWTDLSWVTDKGPRGEVRAKVPGRGMRWYENDEASGEFDAH